MTFNFNCTNCFNGNTIAITKRITRWTWSIALSLGTLALAVAVF